MSNSLANDSNEVLVSCILITYNQIDFVSQAIESILCQKTTFRYEILIGDDCSIDGTSEIVKDYQAKYPDIIKVFLSEENQGAAKNEYRLLEAAKGEYLAPLEGDDYWVDESRLESLVNFLQKNPLYVGVSHIRERRDEQNKLLGYDPSPELLNREFTMSDFLERRRFSIMGSVYINYFKFSRSKYRDLKLSSRNVADFQTCIILLDMGPFYIMDKVYGVYRVLSGIVYSNYNSTTKMVDKYLDHINIINASRNFFENKYDFKKDYSYWNEIGFFQSIKLQRIDIFLRVFSSTSISQKMSLLIKGLKRFIFFMLHSINLSKKNHD